MGEDQIARHQERVIGCHPWSLGSGGARLRPPLSAGNIAAVLARLRRCRIAGAFGVGPFTSGRYGRLHTRTVFFLGAMTIYLDWRTGHRYIGAVRLSGDDIEERGQ